MAIQQFTAGQTLTASSMNTLQASDFNYTRKTITTASYTTVLEDRGQLLEFQNAGGTTVTIPLNSSVAYTVGDVLEIVNGSTATVTIVGDTGVTIEATGDVTSLTSEWQKCQLVKRETNNWMLTGITSVAILDSVITNSDVSPSAAIADTKLATISTAGKVSNSATTATDANTASAIVSRDASGNFIAGKATLATADVVTVLETASIVGSGAGGTINIDFSTNPTVYYTSNASANCTINIRGTSSASLNSVLSTGQIATVTFLETCGAVPYYPNVYQVDGVTVTPKFMGGTAPSAGNANSIDAYTIVIIKTGNAAFTVLASQTRFA